MELRRVPPCRYAITFARRFLTEGRGRVFHGGWPMMIVNALGQNCPSATSPSRRSTWVRPSDRRGDLRGGRCRFPIGRRGGQRRWGLDFGLGSAEADAGRRDRPAGPGRVRGARLRHQVWPAARGRRRDRQPGQQDRPDHRRVFVARCAALLQDRVCVAIVDLVTTRTSNLYSDLIELLGQTDPSLADGPPPLYLRRRLSLGENRTPGFWRPGRIPWRSAGRCRHCRSGSPRTSRYRSSSI